MRYNSIITKAWLLSLPLCLAMGSCADNWDEHYESVSMGEGSLWQIIESDGQLSNFKAVLEATGYKAALDGSQVFTVFAPTNDCFTAEMRDSVINLYNQEKAKGVKDLRNLAIKEFVKNHIALYNYSVNSATNDSIVMMNGKYIGLKSGAFGGNTFVRSNVQTKNGVLFSLSNLASYTPNVYEYISRDADLDSVAGYIYSYSIDYFQPGLSVPGEIVDGKTQYLDSVTEIRNELLEVWMHSRLTSEDSTYWFVAPTNEVWKTLLPEYETYYQYDAKVKGRDSMMYNMPRRAIVEGSLFSSTVNPAKSVNDSVLSTNGVAFNKRKSKWGSYVKNYYGFYKPYAEGGVFDGTEEIVCSNGKVLKPSQWNISKYNTFLQELQIEGETVTSLDSVDSKSTRDLTRVVVTKDNPYYSEVSNHEFSVLAPSGSSNFLALFDIPNVLSNVPYDVYVVAVPAVAGDTAVAESQRVPTKFRCTMQCNDENGKAWYIKTDGSMKTEVVKDETSKISTAATAVFTTDATKVDSVLIGTWTFPTCSKNLEKPQVKLFIEGRTSNTDVNQGKCTKTLRLDQIIFKPHVEE